MDHAATAIDLLESIELTTAEVYEQTDRARERRTALAEIHALLAIADELKRINSGQSHHFATGAL